LPGRPNGLTCFQTVASPWFQVPLSEAGQVRHPGDLSYSLHGFAFFLLPFRYDLPGNRDAPASLRSTPIMKYYR
jgi:hypothetical protein